MSEAAVRGGTANQGAIDAYTLLHVGFGALMQRGGVGLVPTLALSLLWEHVIEPAWKRADPQLFPAPSADRPINSFFDTVGVGTGWLAAAEWSKMSRTQKSAVIGALAVIPFVPPFP